MFGVKLIIVKRQNNFDIVEGGKAMMNKVEIPSHLSWIKRFFGSTRKSMYDKDDSFGGELAGYKGWQDDFRTEIRKDIGGIR